MLNRQVNGEASAVMYAIPDLVFWIDSFEALTNLPVKLKKAGTIPSFTRCRLDFFPIKWSLLEGKDDHDRTDLKSLPYGRFRKALSMVAEQLSIMPNVEELELGYLGTLPITGMGYKFWPDDMMDCFKVLRGFQEVTIKGDLDKTYAEQLAASMKQPKEAVNDQYHVGYKGQEQQDLVGNSLLLSKTLPTVPVNGRRDLIGH